MNKYCPKNDGTCPSWSPACNCDYVYCSLRNDIKIDHETGLIIFDYEDRGEHGFIDIKSLAERFEKKDIK